MADIYAFPQGAPNEARTKGRGSCACAAPPEPMLTRPSGVPDKVWDAVLSVERMPRLSGVSYREIPVPCAMASFGIGVEMDCDGSRDTGWIMVLYSHKYRNDWHSHWRCVAFAALPLPGNERDCLTPSMYWDAMVDQIGAYGVEHVSGTVTVTRSTVFGGQSDAPETGCEIRVSWTPLDYADGGLDAGTQVGAWAEFLQSMTQSEEDYPVD
ncbi:DUF3000 family protein [Bifidobacterium catenulatum]|uniref:DUF3000 family protein n=1 Tax=Bifidobacterium catenulatum TaxID=1686 RepID=UPI003D34D545